MKNIKTILASIIALGAFAGCNPSLESTYEEFLGSGEEVYVGKLTDVVLLSGNQRFVLTGSTKYMNTATQLHITLKDSDYDFYVDVDPSVDEFSYSFENIEAGNYYVVVESVDKAGNKSISATYNVDVYDKTATKNYYSKRVAKASFTALAGTMGVYFNEVDEATSVRFTYIKEDGTEATMELPGDVESVFLTSWKDQSEVNVYTRILPYTDALDELEMDATSFTLPSVPEEMEVPRTYFEWPGCECDTWGTWYGGQICTLWDNYYSYYNQGYHTNGGQGLPSHITIDLGVQAALTKARIMYRPDSAWQDWPAKHMQIWGHKDGNGEDFLEIEDRYFTPEGQFESESIEKGWIKLVETKVDSTRLMVPTWFECPLDEGENGLVEGIRYIRYRALDGWKSPYTGSEMYSMATEMWFFGKSTKILYLDGKEY